MKMIVGKTMALIKKTICQLLLVMGFFIFASPASFVAHAQQGEPVGAIEEIVVTARKRSESIQEAPVAVTAFNAQAIEDAGIRETTDFIQLTSNVSLAESQSISTSFLTIRGLTQVRNGELPVAVVVDGVLLFNNRQFVGQLFDVEQIEVVKGPQGALYGRNATGGAIIISTKQPSNETEGHIQFGLGTGDEVAVEGVVSTPLVEDRLFLRLAGRSVNREGYYTNITRNDNSDPFFNRALRARLAWTPSDDWSVDLNVNISNHVGRGIGFQFDGTVSADDASLPFVANNEDRGGRDTVGVSLKIEKEFEFGVLTSVTSYDDLQTITRADQFPYTALADGVDAAPFGDGTQTQYTDISGWSQEIRLTSASDRKFRWQVGVYYLDWKRFIASTTGEDTGHGIRIIERTPAFDAVTNPTVGFFADNNANNAYAFFGQLEYDLAKGLELSVAGRYDEEDRTQNVSPDNTGGEPGAVNTATFKGFQPKVTLKYSIADSANVYVSWGEGFRSGQFNQNGVAAAAATAGINGVRDLVGPEENESVELGFKADFFDHKLRLNLAYFDTTVKGQQYFVFIGGIGAQVLINIDEVALDGFEAEVIYRITPDLQAYASYGETNSKITRYSTDPTLVGNRAPYIPNSTFNLGFQWDQNLSQNIGFFFRADYEKRGKQFWSPDNTHPRSALNLLNLRMGVKSLDGNWTFAVSANNLTNKSYNSEFVQGGFLHKANPRVWRAEFRYNF